MHPPILSHPLPETEVIPLLDEDDLDDELLAALGVVHHNPNLNLDADMTKVGSSFANSMVATTGKASDGVKCCKRGL